MMTKMDDIEYGVVLNPSNRTYRNIQYNMIEISTKLNDHMIRRKKTLFGIFLLTVIQFGINCISFIDFLSSSSGLVFWLTIVEIFFNLVNISFIFFALYNHNNLLTSQNLTITNYIYQSIYRIGVIFYPWYLHSVYIVISYYILLNAGNLIIQFFFLILGIINSANEHYRIYSNKNFLLFRNLLTGLFVSILLIAFGISLYFILNFLFFANHTPHFYDFKYKILISSSVAFISFILKILIDNNYVSNHKKPNCFYSIFFFLVRFGSVSYIMYLFDYYPNILQIIISNYYSNLVITDYLIKNSI